MELIEASIEGYDKKFKVGECLLDLSVTLGQNDLSSTCTITVADPTGEIAQALINHSLLNGGIQKLQAPSSTPLSSPPPTMLGGTTSGPVAGGNGQGSVIVVGNDPQFTPEIKAFMDLVALHESNDSMTPRSYYSNNGAGFWDDQKDQVSNSWVPRFAGSMHINLGRYQFSQDEWIECKNTPGTNVKGFTPLDQDYMFLWRLKQKGSVAPLMAGDVETAINRAGVEWASLPTNLKDYGQNHGISMSAEVQYYTQRLAYYKGGAAAPSKVTPPTDNAVSPPVITSDVGAAPVKGNKITVTIGEDTYTYYHQSTEYTAEEGKTIIGGQSIRWALDRRKRNKVTHNTSLKQFATQVAAQHGVGLNWLVQGDIQFEVIEQKGLSDYAVLLQQAKQSGYFVSDDSTGITVRPLGSIEDSGLVFRWKRDILSAKFKDEALDGNKVDGSSSALLQNESKATIDPSSGAMVQSKPDIDSKPDNSVTGDKAPVVSAVPVAGQELAQAQGRSRAKRVQGLPSTLVVPHNAQVRTLKPLSTIKTEGFREVLNRLWVCDNVKHEPIKGTTTLNIYSPIEVLDLLQQPVSLSTSPAVTSTAPVGSNVNGYVYPMTTNSPFTDYGSWHKQRPSNIHAGVDFPGGDGGQSIVAIADGLAKVDPYNWGSNCKVGDTSCGGGYGNYVDIDHGNGLTSRYAHMASVTIANGAQIKQGQEVGKCGETGHSFGAHLHFEVFKTGHKSGYDTINPATLPGLKRCGVIGQSVTVGGKD